VAAWPLLVPLFMDDAVTPHMWEARLVNNILIILGVVDDYRKNTNC
jgi:hypothetical protein